MADKKFEQAKADLMEYAVGDNEYEKITTWKELAKWAYFEKRDIDNRASQMQRIIYQAEEEMDNGDE